MCPPRFIKGYLFSGVALNATRYKSKCINRRIASYDDSCMRVERLQVGRLFQCKEGDVHNAPDLLAPVALVFNVVNRDPFVDRQGIQPIRERAVFHRDASLTDYGSGHDGCIVNFSSGTVSLDFKPFLNVESLLIGK